ncbi:MAG: nucleoside-diphosphate sugar epimerase/dehydratase [Flavobacteriales bacterium]|nr:nucleoside-diphosphate sugar epimerase/dehydratase [Flavobacteriales bacterium]
MWLPTKNTPRWLIFIIDLLIVAFSFLVAYLVRFEFDIPSIEVDLAIRFLPILFFIRAVSFVLGRTYAGIIRYTSSQDTTRIFVVLTAGSLVFAGLNQAKYHFLDQLYFIPNSIIILEYLVTLFAMVVSRIAIKVLYLELKSPDKALKRAVIFGAGEAGLITKRTLDRDKRSGVDVFAFVDDDKGKSGKKMEGAEIFHSAKLAELLSSGKVDELILAINPFPADRKAEVIAEAIKHNVRVLNIPPVQQWIGGELSARQIRDVRIEDLLGRDTIQLNSGSVVAQVKDKVVLITGAAGSIGSELVRQLLLAKPSKLIILDQAETPLFELAGELRSHSEFNRCEWVMGDVRQYDRMKRMIQHFHPQIVYHAAAYKHVPLMEDNPSEAVLTNVLGTKNMVDLAVDFGVETFVLISTDKAVNPTSVMGATKRVAEIYAQSKNSEGKTRFITTRFGNVLGSNGSVIPIFKRQIEEGGPVTVTHPDVTRFFMTIPEAVQLVLEAGSMGEGGEIFAFDMGKSVRIMDLAENMIKLSGLELGRDIEIHVSGLRPGEKLFEEVLANEENTLPTYHPKILRARVREYDVKFIAPQIEELISLFESQNNNAIVGKIKQLVPEYKSQNSVFEGLDHN